jgi:antitoxin VapB
MTKKLAKLFTSGGSQAVRLPKEFRFEGSEVAIRRDGDAVILEPVERDWKAFWARIDAMTDGEPLVAPPPFEWPDRDYDL